MLMLERARLIGPWSFILIFSAWSSVPAMANGPRPHNEIIGNMLEVQLKRMKVELKAFQQFESLRHQNLQRERHKYAKLSDRKHSVEMFFNGHNVPSTQAAFRAAMQQSEMSPASADALQMSVPPLEGDQFVAASAFHEILQPDGSLTLAPPVLVGGKRNHELEAARIHLQRVWRRTLQMVGSDSTISYQDIAAMQHSLDHWQQLAAKNLAQSDSIARLRGQKYFMSVRSLIRTVEDPKRRGQLRSYYSGSGMAFEGGTVADLVQHLLNNNLSPRTGTRAHLILSELGHDTLRDLDAQCQLAEQRAEYFTVQNSQSGLDPRLFGAHLAQWSEVSSPGRVPTSTERMEHNATAPRGQPLQQDASVSNRVARHTIRRVNHTIASNTTRH